MLLSVPTAILIVIFSIIIIAVIMFFISVGIINSKQTNDVKNEPEEIKKKADAPELPSEGQEDMKIDGVDKKPV